MANFITHGVNIIRSGLRDLTTSSPTRSSEWKKVERAWIKDHNTCAICGDTVRLQVHHKKPFHLHPELELDTTNLITLCMGKNECHLLVGHGDDFKAYNPVLDRHVTEAEGKGLHLPEITVEAKQLRLFE